MHTNKQTLKKNASECHILLFSGSGKNVKGFQLTVLNMEGEFANHRVCVTFNLSTAEWKDSDIRMGVTGQILFDFMPFYLHSFAVFS